jgi:uncharacterized membrane protein YkvA (DUF1232 family)
MGLWGLFQKWVGLVKEPLVILFAVRDPRVTARQRASAIISVVLLAIYIANPFDLIPEFIPFGFIDDLVIIPLGVHFIERLLPGSVIRESRAAVNARIRPFTLALNIISAVLLVVFLIIIASIIIAVVLLIQRYVN